MQQQELNEWGQLRASGIGNGPRPSFAEMQRWTALPDRQERADTGSVKLPTDEAASEVLIRLGVERADVPGVLATRPDERRDPELWWLLDRCYRLLVGGMGRPDPAYRAWPSVGGSGRVGDFLYAWAFLAALPVVRRYHAAVGLSDVESWDSLSVLGTDLRKVGAGRKNGLGPTWMLPLVFSGVSFRLGRLAFDQRSPHVGAHPVLMPGEASWNVHVPGDGGPITPEACAASIARAVDLSDRIAQPAVVFCCHSWLMEPQLVEYLPSDSNIVQFQSRFDHFTDCRTADADPVHYVFGRQFGSGGDTRAFLDQLPQDTMLQRAIVTVLRSGSHWHTRTGWSRIAAPTDAGGGPEPLGADSSAQETGE